MKLKIVLSILISLILSINIVTAQKKNKKITLSGYVFDSSNNPAVGAMIMIDNKNTQIYTNENGFFKIKIKPNSNLIGVISNDNQFQEDSINGRTSISFILPENKIKNDNKYVVEDSNEIINIGFRTVNSRRTAVAVSKSDVIDTSGDEYSTYNNIYDMIQGRVPGVNVMGSKIRIRGQNTLDGNNDPMFVVDGMPVNSIDHIMPEKVKSITLLKGSAATIYGSRGVNGVVVIELK